MISSSELRIYKIERRDNDSQKKTNRSVFSRQNMIPIGWLVKLLDWAYLGCSFKYWYHSGSTFGRVIATCRSTPSFTVWSEFRAVDRTSSATSAAVWCTSATSVASRCSYKVFTASPAPSRFTTETSLTFASTPALDRASGRVFAPYLWGRDECFIRLYFVLATNATSNLRKYRYISENIYYNRNMST